MDYVNVYPASKLVYKIYGPYIDIIKHFNRKRVIPAVFLNTDIPCVNVWI